MCLHCQSGSARPVLHFSGGWKIQSGPLCAYRRAPLGIEHSYCSAIWLTRIQRFGACVVLVCFAIVCVCVCVCVCVGGWVSLWVCPVCRVDRVCVGNVCVRASLVCNASIVCDPPNAQGRVTSQWCGGVTGGGGGAGLTCNLGGSIAARSCAPGQLWGSHTIQALQTELALTPTHPPTHTHNGETNKHNAGSESPPPAAHRGGGLRAHTCVSVCPFPGSGSAAEPHGA